MPAFGHHLDPINVPVINRGMKRRFTNQNRGSNPDVTSLPLQVKQRKLQMLHSIAQRQLRFSSEIVVVVARLVALDIASRSTSWLRYSRLSIPIMGFSVTNSICFDYLSIERW